MRMRDKLSAVEAVPSLHLGRRHTDRWHVCKREEQQFRFNKLVHHPQLQSKSTKCPERPRFPNWGLEESNRRCGLHEVRTSQHCISFVEIQSHLVDGREKSIDLRHLQGKN